MEYLALILLVLTAIAGIFLTVFQLPGTWLILVAAIAYDWHNGWTEFGWMWLAGFGLVAGIAEIFDTLAGVIAAKKAGASRRAAFGALIGGFAGMIMLTAIPIPVLGTILGGLIGCFLGALVAELSLDKDWKTGAKIGLFATIGKVFGLVAKIAAAMILGGATISLALWSHFSA